MSATAVAFLCATIGAATTVGVWLADRLELTAFFRRANGRVTGEWYGWSIYIPVDGFFSRDREAIYEVVAKFRQRGQRVTFEETLTRLYDIDGTYLSFLPPRRFRGRGTIGKNYDLSAQLWEKGGLTKGSLYVVVDSRAGELTGMLAIRPPIPGRPVAVKILLRRGDQPRPTWEELGVERIRTLASQSSPAVPERARHDATV